MDRREKQVVEGLVRKTKAGLIKWQLGPNGPLVARLSFGKVFLDVDNDGRKPTGRLRVTNGDGGAAVTIVHDKLGELHQDLLNKLLDTDAVWDKVLQELT